MSNTGIPEPPETLRIPLMGLGTAKKNKKSIYRIAGAGKSLGELNYAPDTWPTIFWKSGPEKKKPTSTQSTECLYSIHVPRCTGKSTIAPW